MLSYRDLPILRSAGFQPGASGQTWFHTDKNGNHWQCFVDYGGTKLTFSERGRHSTYLTREEFDALFT